MNKEPSGFKKEFVVPPAQIVYHSGDTNPVTVPLYYRVGGADEHIGHAVVQVEKGILKIVGLSMVEDGLRLLDLSAVLFTDGDRTTMLSIRNNRPKPTGVTLEKS